MRITRARTRAAGAAGATVRGTGSGLAGRGGAPANGGGVGTTGGSGGAVNPRTGAAARSGGGDGGGIATGPPATGCDRASASEPPQKRQNWAVGSDEPP